ncbi:MAG TPA: histidine kinase [Gaiellaceae bacterium]|nr:histidine kinase [Gaiellaceae bacterium]
MASQPGSRSDRAATERRREVLLDAGIAAVVFALSLAMLAARGDSGADARELDPLGVLLAALASLPLVARRRGPLAVFTVTAGASAVLNGLGYPPGPPLGPTVALYFLALSPERTRAPRWLTALVVIGFYVIHAGAAGLAEDEFPTVPLLFGALVWGGAWVIGDRVRQRRARIAELEERALRAEREAERERRLAAAEERTRIARDLHDSAGHAINVILVQAGAARLLQEQDLDRSREALETIEEVARETLGEIDQLVVALREDDFREDTGGRVDPPPGLAALETLAERHRSAGLSVSVRERGARRPLPPALDQASYRILQEALTNAARHGDGSAEVEISFEPSLLELGVINSIRPEQASSGAGHGLVGMRERAALLGGSLEAGASNGVFRVRARLPYGGDGA